MSDPFAPPVEAGPSTEPWRWFVAGGLFFFAGVCALCAVAGLVQDAVVLLLSFEVNGPQMLPGVAVGTVCRTGMCVVLGGGAWMGARAVLWPDTHGLPVIQEDSLRRIYRERHLSARALGPVGPYGDASAGSLLDVYENIDPARAPEKWDALLNAIKARVEADSS